MEEKQKLLDWIKSRDLLSINRVEERCGIPQRMLQKALKELQPLPDKYVPSLQKELKKYGYTPL
jgi:hypothetical protein